MIKISIKKKYFFDIFQRQKQTNAVQFTIDTIHPGENLRLFREKTQPSIFKKQIAMSATVLKTTKKLQIYTQIFLFFTIFSS